MIHQKTPKNITKEILTFCTEISPGETPIYPVCQSTQNSKPGECFPNVIEQVNKHGGSIQHGWKITKLLNLVLEAEFHAIWISPDGNEIDITPDPENETTLFLFDKKKKYEGKQVTTIRKPLAQSPQVHKYIELLDRVFEIMNEGELANQTGEIIVSEAKLLPIQIELAKILGLFENPPPVGRNDPCLCGSGVKYKKCHGM